MDTNAAQKFVESLHQTGFGVLSNHPLQKTQLEALYKNWLENFFKQNENDKRNFLYTEDSQHGYFPAEVSETAKGNDIKDIKEFYQYYQNNPLPEGLVESTQEYFLCAQKIAAEILDWIETYSPEEIRKAYSQPLPAMIKDSELSMLRILHYPPMKGDEEPGAIRAASHEDIDLLTVLPASNEPGLQVLSKENEWIDVPCDFGNLIVNIGDMLQEASQGYFPSTTHRVINPTGKASNHSRISLPLFLHPRPDVVLSSRYTADSFLSERLKELGLIK